MQNRKILGVGIILILLIGLTTQAVIAKESEKDAIVVEDSLVDDSITSVPSAQTYTGCLTTISRWNMPKGVLYFVRLNSTPAGTCISGDTTISFVKKDYINALETRITKSESSIAKSDARIAKLEKLLANVTRSGNNIYINRANLNIRDGSGSTDGPTNGLGNLIIGYNEKKGIEDIRTGSHNLIIGQNNNYKSYGGIVAGYNNEISGIYAFVTGGLYNTASGNFSSISGGDGNIASGSSSAISGGGYNIASGGSSSVSGGIGNKANGDGYASISGGWGNTASGRYSSISGGNARTVTGNYDWAAGGLFQDS